jgi:hypothetical protein
VTRGGGDDEPQLQIAGFSLWIHGRQFPDLHDYWDGNWLIATAQATAPGAVVEATGPFIRNTELLAFAGELAAMNQTLNGKARLNCLEPHLDLVLACDGLGNIEMTLSITPEHLTQRHEFIRHTDQTALTPVIASIKKVLEVFPVRGKPDD